MLTIHKCESNLTHVYSSTLVSNFRKVLSLERRRWAPKFHEPLHVEWGGDWKLSIPCNSYITSPHSLFFMSSVSPGYYCSGKTVFSAKHSNMFAVKLWAKDNRTFVTTNTSFYSEFEIMMDLVPWENRIAA